MAKTALQPNLQPRLSRTRTFLINLILVLVSTGLALGCGEVGVRLMSSALGVTPYMEYDDMLGWTATPNTTKVHRSDYYGFDVVYRINDQRFRGEPHEKAKPPGVTRIVILGDSNGFGWGIPEGRQFAALVESGIQNAQVINLSLSGYGTDQEYLRFVREGVSLQPDVVILQLTPNDFEEIQYPFFNQKPKPQFVVNDGGALTLVNVPVRAYGPKAEEFFGNSIPLPFREWFGWHSYAYNYLNEKYYTVKSRFRTTGTAAAQVQPIFSPRSFMLFNAIVRELQHRLDEASAKGLIVYAAKEIHNNRAQLQVGLPVVDVYESFVAAQARGEEPWFKDGYHFNQVGHRIVADALIEAIKGLTPSK